MISTPLTGQHVQIWYGKPHRDTMPWHGMLGTAEIVGRARPRNHGIRIDGGPMVIVPAGNLRVPRRPARPRTRRSNVKLSDLTPLQLADERVKLLAALKDARDELLVVAAELGESEDGIPALYRAISAIADAEAPTP